MDKRSIIGFVLIMAILVLWQMWFMPTSKPPVAPATTDTTAIAQDSPSGKTNTLPAWGDSTGGSQAVIGEQTAIDTIPVEPEQLVKVETDDVIVTLSSYGGIIKSIKLKHYFVQDGADGDSLVELLTPLEKNPYGAPGVLTLGDEDKILPINNAPFKIEGGDIALTKGNDPAIVSFIYSDQATGGMIRKDYTFSPEKYQIKFRLTVENPKVFGFDDKLTVGWMNPNWPTEKELKRDLEKFAGFYSMGGEVVENKSLKDGKLDLIASGESQWVANRSKYFTNVILTVDTMGSEILVTGRQAKVSDYENKLQDWRQFGVGLTFDLRGSSFSNDFLIYAGPLDYYQLENIGYNLGQLVDMGWKVFRPFAIGILWIFVQMYKFLFNYGIVIIVFSLIMKAVFWPLTRKSSMSMMKMKDLQPKLQEIKDKYTKDPAKLQMETMKVYKEYGVNPFSSCLPLIIQLPIFWALFSVLNNSIEFRAAELAFWITDLSQRDSTWVLPILMGIAMFFQQIMTITDPKQKMIAYIMPAVFIFIFGSMPAGLVLYWTIFSIVGIGEQLLIKKHLDEEKRAKAAF